MQVLSAEGRRSHQSLASQQRDLEPCIQPTTVLWYSAGISSNGRTTLVVVPGSLTGCVYIDEILQPHVVPYLHQMGQNVIFQDNNVRPHRVRIVDDFLRQNGVEQLEWRPMSTDLSCIEHVGYSWPGRNQAH